jgi:hypothetical protein
MIRLTRAVVAWGSPDFEDVLKEEIRQLNGGQLPLQQGLSRTSYALHDKFDVRIIGVSDEINVIRAKMGIFYYGIIAGCSCADDPTPINEESEYCEVQLDIEKATGDTTVVLLAY